jgi:hypothetical protein
MNRPADIKVRPIIEIDHDAADRVARMAFGTFLRRASAWSSRCRIHRSW